jgi:hypothetical protein
MGGAGDDVGSPAAVVESGEASPTMTVVDAPRPQRPSDTSA